MGVAYYLRYADLKARRIIPNRATLRNRILRHGFPLGHQIGPNMRGWTEDEVEEWLKNQPPPKPPKPYKPKRPRGRPRKVKDAEAAVNTGPPVRAIGEGEP
jgi:hypothetical protein